MNVTLYIRTGDPYSDMIKNLLRFHKIEFDIVEISSHPEKLNELKELSGQENTPVLRVDDRVFIGFDREKIKELLGIESWYVKSKRTKF